MNARTAIYFHEDGFVETPDRASQAVAKKTGVVGPMGRHVAGKEFLTAYLQLSQASDFYFVTPALRHAKLVGSLAAAARRGMPQCSVNVFLMRDIERAVQRSIPIQGIHYPAPIDVGLAWVRQHLGNLPFALSGITHTICTEAATRAMCDMVTAPLEPFDSLICISRAAVATVRNVTDAYCAHLRERFGGDPKLRIRLENIPLGVDVEKFRPPTAQERATERLKFGIDDEEIAVLYLGRLLHYGKVNPFPIYDGLAAAAKATGKKVRLIMAGWAANEKIMKTFKDGAASFAPGVTVDFIDGRGDEVRYRIWWAADIFAFPTDNLQETFPQSVIEAMSCGLPVVASDWDGCRDQVVHEETGFLVPTYLVKGSTSDSTAKLLGKGLTYPEFMARCSQAAAVDLRGMAQAFITMINHPEMRAKMGAAGRKRAVEEFAWQRIIKRYEQLWKEQETERQAYLRKSKPKRAQRPPVPSIYPPPEESFASYPLSILDLNARLRTTADAFARVESLMKHPLTQYSVNWRSADPALINALLTATLDGATVIELDEFFRRNKISLPRGRSTVAWCLKYGLMSKDG